MKKQNLNLIRRLTMKDYGDVPIGALDAMNDAAYYIQELESKLSLTIQSLEFYSGVHEPALSFPNEGPWGVNSTDFGKHASLTLKSLNKKKTR